MLTPPLNKIPAIPDQLVSILDNQITKLLDSITFNCTIAIQEAVSLPDDIKCDDPRLEALRKRIEQVNTRIQKLQEIVPIINKITAGLNTIVGIANTIKAAQLLNPITALPVIAMELVLAQNLTIANAGTAVDKLVKGLAPKINANLNELVSSLVPVANIIGQACNQNTNDLGISGTQGLQNALNNLDYSDSIPGYGPGGVNGGDWILISGSGELGSPIGVPPTPKSPFNDGKGTWLWSGEGYNNVNGVSWGSTGSRVDDYTMGTEFYTQQNVSVDNIKQYLDIVNNLVDAQQSLLTSLQEAPAQSYNGETPPADNLGKIGDYYVDTVSKHIYGPKTNNGWGTPVNY